MPPTMAESRRRKTEPEWVADGEGKLISSNSG